MLTVSCDKVIILADSYDEIKKQIFSMNVGKDIVVESKYYFFKQTMLNRYKDNKDEEIEKILAHIKKNNLQVFNYDFVDKYQKKKIEVFFDKNCGMYYVYHTGKKMYFSKEIDDAKKVEDYYRSLMIEQDEESPHRYLTSQFNIKEGDIVVDVGAAEGNFSLEIVDKASKIYIIEADKAWLEALQETFEEYKEKVVIIKKYITSVDEGDFATIDSLIDEAVNFIKMDIEGNEWDALLGAKSLFGKSSDLKCAICSYHRDYDEILIKDVLRKYGIQCSTTPGYMWFPWNLNQKEVSTRLCRGIVRGNK